MGVKSLTLLSRNYSRGRFPARKAGTRLQGDGGLYPIKNLNKFQRAGWYRFAPFLNSA